VRKVFSSQRLENVDAVATLLREAGIEVKIEHGRSFRTFRHRGFSYDMRKQPEELPSVWIMRAEDQPRGRQLLREAGLLEESRDPAISYLPTGRHQQTFNTAGGFSSKRIKLGALLLIGVVIALITIKQRSPAEAQPTAPVVETAPAAAPRFAPPETITEVEVYRIDTPSALASKLISDTLRQHTPAAICLHVDEQDPSPAMLAAVEGHSSTLHPASRCPDASLPHLSISDYMTDGSGEGDIRLRWNDTEQQLHVQRNGVQWRVLSKK
jgi:hypothetical protein